METTKQVHAVIPVHAARAVQYPQPWLMLMRDKLSYGEEIAVVAYDDRETLGIAPLYEGFVILDRSKRYDEVIGMLTLGAIVNMFGGRQATVSKWWPGMTIHDDPETIIVGV